MLQLASLPCLRDSNADDDECVLSSFAGIHSVRSRRCVIRLRPLPRRGPSEAGRQRFGCALRAVGGPNFPEARFPSALLVVDARCKSQRADSPIVGRTLPLRVAPIAGEALDSWLEAIAFRYQVPLGDVMSRCGMQPAERTTRRLLSPTHDEILYISAVSGIDIAAIQSMTWQRYLAHSADAEQPRYLPWSRRGGSRFCPHCLRESHGRWLLTWRLNWTFACLRHRCVLADSCSACRTTQRRQPLSRSRIPRLGRCPTPCYWQAENTMVECNADLGAADVLLMPRTHPVLSAQATIDALLDGNRLDFALYGGATPQCAVVLSDLRLLAQWVTSAVEQVQLDHYLPADVSSAVSLHRRATMWPHDPYWRSPRTTPSALDTAAGVTLALRVISLRDIAEAVAVLQRLMKASTNGGPYWRTVSRRSDLTPALRSALDTAYARDNTDRKLQGRLARKLAVSRSVTPRLPYSAR
jgi:hypothetical protein